MTCTLGFFTQHEIDPLVGYRRKRERWEGHQLPAGARVKTYGQEPIIFPEFAVVGLIVGRMSAADRQLLERVRDEARLLYETLSFKTLAKTLRTALRGHTGWTLTDVVLALREQSEDALLSWREEVTGAEARLARAGIILAIRSAQVSAVTDAGYRLRLDGALETVACPFNASSGRLSRGSWVTLDSIALGARKGEVLVPTVAPDILPVEMRTLDTSPTTENEWDELFAGVEYTPVVVPRLNRESETSGAGDVVRPRRRLQVNLDPSLYAHANTMTRRPREHHPVR